MTEDVSLELQGAIFQVLKNDADLSALVGGRIYDRVPSDPSGKITATFPYISFGDDQDVPEYADCIDASELFIDIEAWSREPGYPEVKRIAKAVEAALHEAELVLADNALVYLEYNGRRVIRARDGLTSQAVISFRAGVEKN